MNSAAAIRFVLFMCSYVLLQWLSATLRFPPVYMSALWLPGALLLACLLLAPMRQWWLYLAASSVAAVVAHVGDSSVPLPAALVTLPFFLTGAAGGAWLIRRLGGERPLETLTSLLALALVAVILIPLMAAGPVAVYRNLLGQSGWPAARGAGLAIALGTLIGTPALTLTLRDGAAWLARATWRRWLEVACLALALLGVGMLTFAGPGADEIIPAMLYAPLPLLLWAAVRFSLAGISWAMLGVAVLAAQAAQREWGPFAEHAPHATVLQLQLFLIAASAPLMFLATIIQDRRRVAAQLGASEERYREVVESQSDLVCRYLPDTTLTFVNDAYCRFFGRTRQGLIGRRWIELIPPAAHASALGHLHSLSRERRTITYEHEVLLPDGTIGWHQWIDYAAAIEPDGSIAELQGIGRDITDRKRAENALRQNEEALRHSYLRIQELAGRLIEAQEGERSRLARELHDNVSQQLAALSIALSTLRRRLGPDTTAQEELTRLQSRMGELAEDIRHLSHELHPGVLRHAGLVAALRSRCAEFRVQHGIEATLVADEEFDQLPQAVSLCLYRVAQEALRNIAKHASARRASMTLARSNGCLELTVADDGIGFDAAQARGARGLGLMSLDERVRLINGQLEIESAPRQGTQVRVRVPVEAR